VRGALTSNIADLAVFTVANNDGLTYSAGQRILLAGQSTGAQEGIYVVGAVGGGTAALTRAPDWAAAAVVPGGTLVVVDAGTANANTVYMVTNAAGVTVATTDPTFTQLRTAAQLASVASGLGASLIGIQDAGTLITAATVEGALAEFAAANWVTTARILDANVTYAKIASGTGLSLVGRSANSAGVNADIVGTDGQVARISGTALGFGTIVAAGIAANAVETAKILDGNVTAAKLAAASLVGTQMAVVADDAVIGGIEVCHIVAIADGVTADKDITLTHKTEITRIEVIKTGAAGGASDTIQVKNVADAITDAMSINVADKIVVRPATIDDAFTVVAAGTVLRVTMTKASAANTACRVLVWGVRRT
jgi:hypothetical protein